MFRKLLIANRGEIACRVIATAKSLGIRTIAVYSDADAGARHVRLADEAHRIGPPSPAESYLCIDRLVDVARRSRADAIHPGYGFLAENADFAEACAAEGVVFVGPPPSAIRAMGRKDEAKRLMEEAGVPVVPGFHDDDSDPARLRENARDVGYPLLIKPVAGGGGKGMRRVDEEAGFDEALAGARREAKQAFGDDRVLLERFLPRSRHIEIQVFADTQGRAIHLFERDCSMQRRHQKVLEEAPAPGITAAMRRAMGGAAVAATRAIGYVGAGTVEFLADVSQGLRPEAFWFLEMNARLQVEHPVTEMVTGQDLVAWQLRVAAGEPLPLRQRDLAITGHAIEARLYAEDPSRGFLPSTGRLVHLHLPDAGAHARVDTGVREGDRVTPHYDPMLAKLVVWGRDRAGAARRLAAALGELRIAGVVTNAPYLSRVVAHPAFLAGEVHTAFLEQHRQDLLPPPGPPAGLDLMLATAWVILERRRQGVEDGRRGGDRYSPWHLQDGWRVEGGLVEPMRWRGATWDLTVQVLHQRAGWRMTIGDRAHEVAAEAGPGGGLEATIDGVRRRATVIRDEDRCTVFRDGFTHLLRLVDPLEVHVEEAVGDGRMTAPMPGKIIAVPVAPGDRVCRGQSLIVLEAMKMEHTIHAPADGTVEAIHFALGDAVEEGADLLDLVLAEGGGAAEGEEESGSGRAAAGDEASGSGGGEDGGRTR